MSTDTHHPLLSINGGIMALCYITLLLILPLQQVVAVSSTLEYYHYNHQGSLLEVYDGTSNRRMLSQAWSPWGERQVLYASVSGDKNNISHLMAHGLPVHRGYTGHKQLLATDLIFAGDTRLYDPRLKRFLNSDDRTTGAIRGQNRYSYAYNNPMTYIDPDGRAAIIPQQRHGWMRTIKTVLDAANAVGAGLAQVPMDRERLNQWIAASIIARIWRRERARRIVVTQARQFLMTLRQQRAVQEAILEVERQLAQSRQQYEQARAIRRMNRLRQELENRLIIEAWLTDQAYIDDLIELGVPRLMDTIASNTNNQGWLDHSNNSPLNMLFNRISVVQDVMNHGYRELLQRQANLPLPVRAATLSPLHAHHTWYDTSTHNFESLLSLPSPQDYLRRFRSFQ